MLLLLTRWLLFFGLGEHPFEAFKELFLNMLATPPIDHVPDHLILGI